MNEELLLKIFNLLYFFETEECPTDEYLLAKDVRFELRESLSQNEFPNINVEEFYKKLVANQID